ncbi:Hsp70 family protein [Actinomycetospora chiangmaiensis]|uniref:Hsp70 family protein n=1 Tax=Actinomycetospora chiangmaiensis TaxID=402650 RepID=UPI0003770B56|nr:Hsp70 family protein [Actinomycetospora chiangmaiensis]
MNTARYRLGIDLGTTYTAAALSRAHGRDWSEPEIVALGSQSASVASVLYLGAPEQDGSEPFLVGEAAERRAHAEPDRVVRQFKRRVGDDVPLVVGDAVHTAQDLAARMARWVVDKVAAREGGPADLVAITHPASWGDHKRELLAGALRDAGLTSITFLPEPQAAAVAYAAKERVEVGGTVAVYDLGGGTFDSAVVRRTAAGFELPGRPEGIEQLGGVDFDDRVFSHVLTGLGAAFDDIDPEDPDVVSAVTRLRRECVEAKEALSADTAVSIPVMLPSLRTTVRLTRHEFEAMIRSSLDHTVAALRRTVESASLTPEDLQAVLLVGGSSRIPLVAQMVSEDLGRPVAVDTDPKTAIAVGAVLTIAPRPEPVRRAATSRAAVEPLANAADAAAATSTLARGAAAAAAAAGVAAGAAARGDTDSGLLDLRGQALPAAPATPPGVVRTGPPSGPLPAVGPPSGRLPALGPPSGRGPVIGPPSGGFVPGPRSGRLPVDPSGRFAAQYGAAGAGPAAPTEDETRTVRHHVGGVPARPPVSSGGAYPGYGAELPPTPVRSRTRLVVMVAAAVALVAALTTGGVVYARSATVSATVAPPSSTSVPPPVTPSPTEAAVGNPAPAGVVDAGTGGNTGGSGSGGSSSSGGSWGGSSSGHHPTTTTTTTTTTTSRKVATTPASEPSGQASN